MNKNALLETWAPVIEQTVGQVSTDKARLIATIAQLQENYEHRLNENGGTVGGVGHYSTIGNVNGMNATTLPSATGNGWGSGASDTTNGSGDVPYSLLPLAIQVAAQTIGLELVPTVPMNGPIGMISYMDFVYAGGKNGYAPQNSIYPNGTNGANGNSPIYVEAKVANELTGVINGTVIIGTAPNDVTLTFLGYSRINGYAIFKLPETLVTSGGTAKTVAQLIPSSTTVGAPVATTGTSTVGNIITPASLVRGLENHIPDFTTNSLTGDPMSRLEGETTPINVGNLSLFSKSVEAKTVQAAAAVTREQLMDLKQFGIDAMAQANQFLANEMTQTINKDILKHIFDLGRTNAHQIESTQAGLQFNLVLGSANTPLTIGAGVLTTNDWVYMGTGKPSTTVPQVDAANLGAENLGTRQRRLMSKLLAVSNMISVRGRRGPATFAVCSNQIASALQDCVGFVAYPMVNSITQVPGALYPIGTLAGLAIYVDPNMDYTDGRIAVGRKGDGNSPGLVFMPYVMADTVEQIVEGTGGPKISMKSRYALVHAGHHPQTMYLTFCVKNTVDQYWA